ncbi:MAG: ABC transporter permease [Leucobacter sp.]
MTGLILRRLVFTAFALLIISVAVFGATMALPGDAAIARLGASATPESLAALRERMNLDAPLLQQYFGWLGSLLRGDLGLSFSTSIPVGAYIGPKVANSLVLLLITTVIAVPIATGMGVWTALRRDGVADRVSTLVLLVIVALPEFVVAVLIIALLSTNVFRLFPAVSIMDPSRPWWEQATLLVLPAITLVIVSLPYIARTVRASMAETLESEFISMARMKGVSENRVIWRHALPNIAGPWFQVTAQSIAYLAGGIVVVEAVFQFPGVGYQLISSIGSRDLPVIQALALLLAAFYILLNAVADMGTIAMTPTMRKGKR